MVTSTIYIPLIIMIKHAYINSTLELILLIFLPHSPRLLLFLRSVLYLFSRSIMNLLLPLIGWLEDSGKFTTFSHVPKFVAHITPLMTKIWGEVIIFYVDRVWSPHSTTFSSTPCSRYVINCLMSKQVAWVIITIKSTSISDALSSSWLSKLLHILPIRCEHSASATVATCPKL